MFNNELYRVFVLRNITLPSFINAIQQILTISNVELIKVKIIKVTIIANKLNRPGRSYRAYYNTGYSNIVIVI